MQLDDVYAFFQAPRPTFIRQELAVCYVLSVLLQGDSYGTGLIQGLEENYPGYKLSDTVLYSALDFLETEHVIVSYWYKVQGRGRPRHMFKLDPARQELAQELAQLWQGYVTP